MLNPVKSFGHIKCYSSSRFRHGERPSKSTDTTVRRSAVAWENLKPNQESEKSHLYSAGQWFITYKVFKDFTNRRKKD